MPRALVTGATGFVGSNLVAYLRQQGWQVDCLVRDISRAAQLEQLGATAHLGKLSDPESITNAAAESDVIFHVAGRVRALREEEFTRDNVDGTLNIVEAAKAQSKPPTVVFVSSLAAAGPSKPGSPVRETDEDRPISAYGLSKLAAEKAIAQHADEVPISIVRPPIIFGPADKASLAIFQGIKLIRIHAVPGLRQFPVSLVHVTDLCNALLRVAEKGSRIATSTNGRATGTYYVAAERTIPYGELGKLAAQALDLKGVALPLPKAMFWLMGGTMELVGQMARKPSVLNLDKIREAVAPGWECSDEKIRQELAYEPAATLEERFADTAQWYREQRWL